MRYAFFMPSSYCDCRCKAWRASLEEGPTILSLFSIAAHVEALAVVALDYFCPSCVRTIDSRQNAKSVKLLRFKNCSVLCSVTFLIGWQFKQSITPSFQNAFCNFYIGQSLVE